MYANSNFGNAIGAGMPPGGFNINNCIHEGKCNIFLLILLVRKSEKSVKSERFFLSAINKCKSQKGGTLRKLKTLHIINQQGFDFSLLGFTDFPDFRTSEITSSSVQGLIAASGASFLPCGPGNRLFSFLLRVSFCFPVSGHVSFYHQPLSG